MQSLLSLITLMLLVTPSLFTQPALESFNKTIKLDGQSNVEKIEINVRPDSEELVYGLNGKINDGSVRLTLYDPKGNRKNGMGLKTKKGRKCKGVLEEAIAYPSPGIWTLKIKKKGVKGTVKVKIDQH